MVIGQPELVATLAHASADAARIRRGEPGPSMTHAWLLTGPPGLRALDRRAGLRRRPAVPERRLRNLRDLPPGPRARARRRGPVHPGEAADHRRGVPRADPPGVDDPDHGPLERADRRGRRPAQRRLRQRPPQVPGGAEPAHGVDPVRADARGRAADDRVAHPAGPAAHAHDHGRSPRRWSAARGSTRPWPRSLRGPPRVTSGGPARWRATSRCGCAAARCWPSRGRCET